MRLNMFVIVISSCPELLGCCCCLCVYWFGQHAVRTVEVTTTRPGACVAAALTHYWISGQQA